MFVNDTHSMGSRYITLWRAARLFVFMLVLATPVSAQTPQPLQGLFLSQVPYLQDKGEVQVTMTRQSGRTRLDHQSQIGFEWGLTSQWQLELEAVGRHTPTVPGESRTGVESVGATVDRGFTSHDHSLRYTVGASIETSMGQLDSDESRITISPSVSIMKDLPALHQLRVLASGSASVALFTNTFSGERKPEYNMQVAAFMPISLVRFTAEWSQSNATRDDGTGQSPIVAPGIVVPLPHGFELGAATLFALGRDARFVSKIFKLAYEF